MKTRTKFYIAFFVAWFLLSAMPMFADEGDPPNPVARLSYMENAVSFEPAGENDWSQATLNYPLTTGDRLWTDTNARAELETGNVAIRMAPQTDLTTTNLSDQLIQLGLAQGTLRIRAFDLRPDHSIEVDTSNAALTIVQAGSYRIETYPDQNMTVVTVNNGALQATGNGLNQTVGSGQALQLTGSNPVQINWVAVNGADDFDQWSAQRDQKYANAQARQYVSPEVPGYYDLDGYGTWATEAQYGPVWYPSAVPVGWAPYRYGRWVWVEPWGWTWVDQAPWGFAPFHYGRWVQVGPRWGWLPGPVAVAPIYGPAFVAFVGGPQFSVAFGTGGVAAWFPLGPGEPFYPWYHYSPGYLRQVNVTNVRNINVTNITNVTNINNIHYRYQTVATTAVNAETFRNAQPVMRNLVRVDPQQIARARVIPHPQINPTPRAILAGSNTTRPPVPLQRPAVVQHPPVASVHAAAPPNTVHNVPPSSVRPVVPSAETAHPNVPPRTTPSENRTPPDTARTAPEPPNRNVPESHATPPPVNNRPVEPPTQGYRAAPPTSRPPLVANTPPPTPKLPYEQKAPAMEQHPGRPLEPQQRANISAGKPAGPMMDREVPPHAGPMPPASHSAPSSHSAPGSKESPPKH
ncbi:MAG: DUF6600 domain-containing protein [Candidatus Korobacteraceae bacterium]